MAPSIILIVGLDQIPMDRYPANVVAILAALKGFGTTPVRFVLMGAQRHHKDLRVAIAKAIIDWQKLDNSCTGPSSIDVESIDSPQDRTASSIVPSARPDLVNQWLSARVAELASGMGGMKTSGDSSAQSVEANHGSDSDGAGAAARLALESMPSPFAATLGCVVVVDGQEHVIPVVGEGHCIEIRGEDVTPKEAFRISQVVRRTPSATQRHGLPTDVDLTGIVKRFNPTKGFGFITVNDQDVFVHQSHIRSDGFRGLNVGATVSLRVEINNGRPEARSVAQRTPYVASYESQMVVEGAHKFAGAPVEVRKGRKSIRPPTSAQAKPTATQDTRTRSAPAKRGGEEKQKGAAPARAARAASASPVQHPRGQLVFSSETVNYSFRAHDGTLYYFPMPILERSKGPARRTAAHTVSGGFNTRRGVSAGGRFAMVSPSQQREIGMAPLPPPYMLSRRLQGTASLSASQSASFEIKTPTQPNVRRHSPYEHALMVPQPINNNAAPPPPNQSDAEQRLRQLVNRNNIASNLAAGPANGTYAAALLNAHKAPQNGVLKIRTEEQSTNSYSAGIVQVPRRQR